MVNILVVDDDEQFQKMLADILTCEGYTVKCFGNGEEAIDASYNELFNLALIDMRLPDMEGTEILSQLRKTEPETIKIIITGNATLDNSIEAANKGVDGYLTKPFDPKQLIKLIEAKLEEQKKRVEFNETKVAEYIGMRYEWMANAKIKGKKNQTQPQSQNTSKQTSTHTIEPQTDTVKKRIETSLVASMKKLEPIKTTEQLPIAETISEGTQANNVVFLLDGSSSMRKEAAGLSNFEIAKRAIATVLTNPDQAAKENRLSVIVFWSEILRGFQKEVLYQSVPMNKYIDPGQLYRFEKPKRNVGTPFSEALKYVTDFLKASKGNKIVKLITDSEVPLLKDDETVLRLKNNSIKLDLVVVGADQNLSEEKTSIDTSVGVLFESSDVESLALKLKA